MRFFSCSDYRSGVNVVNESSINTEFEIRTGDGFYRYSSKKTLEPNEIWKFGFFTQDVTKNIIKGTYSVYAGNEYIVVSVNDKSEDIIVKWDGTCFKQE